MFNRQRRIQRLRNQASRRRQTRNLCLGTERLDDRRLLAAEFTLQLLHASDLEGGVDAIPNAPSFAALVDTFQQDATSGADATVTISAGDNYIPGPFFSAAGDRGVFRDGGVFNDTYNTQFATGEYDALREGSGRVDISVMNIIGFDASAVGNHEFDQGSDAFESIIEEDFRDPAGPESDRWVGAQFPYLSANLDFSGDADLGNLFTPDLRLSSSYATGPDESLSGETSFAKIAPFTVIDAGGEPIGVIGATTQLLETITSPTGTVGTAGTSNDMQTLADVLNPQIDQLKLGLDGVGGTADDIDKIILTSHLQQISLEQELIGLLDGVDIVIAGGSDTILADGNDELRPEDIGEVGGSYPLLTTNREGAPAAIVSTDGEYSYVGRLVVGFDAAGQLVTDTIDDLVSGAYATIESVVTSVTGAADTASAIAASTKATEVEKLTDAVSGLVTERDGNVFGETSVFIEGRREFVRTEETTLGNLTADANLAAAQDFDLTVVASLKNGGGIRAEIGSIDGETGELLAPQANPTAGKLEGQISQLDIENTLRFNNRLTLLTLTSQELKYVLEHAVAATGPGSTPGQFPQVGGLKFSYDPNGTPINFNSDADIAGGAPVVAADGSRILNVSLEDGEGNVTVLVENGVPVNPDLEVRLVTLDFLFGDFLPSPNFGGDGYPFKAFAEDVVKLADEALPVGSADFAQAGSEQDAFAEYLVANFGDAASAFDTVEVGPELDRRIQDITVRADTVIPVDGTVFVTNGDDFGVGSFRNAAQIASDNPGVDRIVIRGSVDLITIDSEVVFSGAQDLEIKGNGTTLLASDAFVGDGLFVSSGGADLEISKLTVDGDYEEGETTANGIFVPVPADATGTLHVSLDKVTLLNAGLFGLHIDDQLPEEGDTEYLAGFDSDASIALVLNKTRVENNGIGALDYDGIRVDDGGLGGIETLIEKSSIDGNGGDGLELDERGPGGVWMTVENSTFNDNGFFNEADLDDGLDVDEAGPGGLHAVLENVRLVGNLDEGLDLDEEDEGSVHLTLENVVSKNNLDEGIKVSEEDAGGILALMEGVVSRGNGDDGIELEEADAGSIFAVLSDISASRNGDSGIQFEESGEGSLLAWLDDVHSRRNEGHGLDLSESGRGVLLASVTDSLFSRNGEFGIAADQADQGLGALRLDDVDFTRNSLGSLDLAGLALFGDSGGDDDDD